MESRFRASAVLVIMGTEDCFFILESRGDALLRNPRILSQGALFSSLKSSWSSLVIPSMAFVRHRLTLV